MANKILIFWRQLRVLFYSNTHNRKSILFFLNDFLFYFSSSFSPICWAPPGGRRFENLGRKPPVASFLYTDVINNLHFWVVIADRLEMSSPNTFVKLSPTKFLPRVDCHVLCQVSFLCKSFTTQWTTKAFLPSMTSHVVSRCFFWPNALPHLEQLNNLLPVLHPISFKGALSFTVYESVWGLRVSLKSGNICSPNL